uniref:Uncharacterized protein n=1 Tax=Lepeophtheirus salmonis TaxID=72036 RepID=A0A0K2UMA1_LEPSM
MRDFAKETASGLPVIVIRRSFSESDSLLLEIRIMALDKCRISAILEPPFPMIQPMESLGIDISKDVVFLLLSSTGALCLSREAIAMREGVRSDARGWLCAASRMGVEFLAFAVLGW